MNFAALRASTDPLEVARNGAVGPVELVRKELYLKNDLFLKDQYCHSQLARKGLVGSILIDPQVLVASEAQTRATTGRNQLT
jgi:hypothetical protein